MANVKNLALHKFKSLVRFRALRQVSTFPVLANNLATFLPPMTMSFEMFFLPGRSIRFYSIPFGRVLQQMKYRKLNEHIEKFLGVLPK